MWIEGRERLVSGCFPLSQPSPLKGRGLNVRSPPQNRLHPKTHNPGPISDPGLRDCDPVQLYFLGGALATSAGAVPPDFTGSVFGTS
jgi:hypothetical protein